MSRAYLYHALTFRAPHPNGSRSYASHVVAAHTQAEAAQILRAKGVIDRTSDTFVATDEIVHEYEPVIETHCAAGNFDPLSREQYDKWVSVQTRGAWLDGVFTGPSFERVRP